MSMGFRILTGGSAPYLELNSDSTPPGMFLETFVLANGATVVKDYTSLGITRLITMGWSQDDPEDGSVSNGAAYPRFSKSGGVVTCSNSHPYAAYGWGGPAFIQILGY